MAKRRKTYNAVEQAKGINQRKKELESIKQLISMNSISKAHSELIKYMERYPNDYFGILLYGKLCIRLKDYENARLALEKVAAAKCPSQYTAISELGNVAVAEGRYDEARMFFNRVLTESTNSEENTIISWVKLERKLKNYQRALEILDMATTETTRIALEKVKVLNLLKRTEESQKIIRGLKPETEDPQFKRVLNLEKARSEKLDGEYETIMEYLHMAKDGPKDAIYIQALFEETKFNARHKKIKEATEGIDELMTFEVPFQEDVFLTRGIINQAKKAYEQAIADYEVALTSNDPATKSTASYHLGCLMFAKGEFARAEQLFLNSLNNKCEYHQAAYFKLIALYVKQNRADEAEILINQVKTTFPDYDVTSCTIAERIISKIRGEQVTDKHLSYTEIQILNYSKNYALSHIWHRHFAEREEKTTFSEGIDELKIFAYAQEHMTDENRIYDDILDGYIIDYPGCGEEDGKPINQFRVVAIPNTKNIITMYPSNEEFLPRKKDYKTDTKPKQMSRLDKFNQRLAAAKK